MLKPWLFLLSLLLAQDFAPPAPAPMQPAVAGELVAAAPAKPPAALDHRITVKFTAHERQWQRLGTPLEFTFDSASPDAILFNLDRFLEGHYPGDATGHIWRSWLKPTPFGDPYRSLRITWWQYRYPDGSQWIAGAVLSDSIESPVTRLRGKIEVNLCDLDGKVREAYPPGVVTINLQNGFGFSFGAPGQWVNWEAIRFYVNSWGNAGSDLPPPRLFAPATCPDRIGGNGPWLPQWTPHRIDVKDASGAYVYPKYWNTSDPRNPPIGATIGECEVSDLYNDQTHAHFRENFDTPFMSGWQAHARAADKAGARHVLRSLAELSRRQVGCWSPALGPPHFCEGRPVYLSFLNGDLLRARTRYYLTATDRAALRPWIGHEGRLQIDGGKWQFVECMGQDSGKSTSENQISGLELTQSQYGGLYGLGNGWDMEHGGTEQIFAAANLLADPLAMVHLHHWAEEYITNGVVKHSSRQVGWMIVTELLAGMTFYSKPSFTADAQRYFAHAREIAQWIWSARIDETPYQGLLSRAFERLDPNIPEADWRGYEAAFQAGIALHAFYLGAHVDPDPTAQELYVDLADYTARLFLQPGIVQRPTPTSRGGFLDSWNLLGPVPESQMPGASIEERLRANSGNYKGVEWLSDQGWAGPALAEAAMLLKGRNRPGWEEIDKLAREVLSYQKQQNVGGKPFFDVSNWVRWGMHFSQVRYGLN